MTRAHERALSVHARTEDPHMPHRTELQREVAEALISTKAIDFDAVGRILSKYGERAALGGDGIGAVVNWRMVDICIPVDWVMRHDIPQLDAHQFQRGNIPGG